MDEIKQSLKSSFANSNMSTSISIHPLLLPPEDTVLKIKTQYHNVL